MVMDIIENMERKGRGGAEMTANVCLLYQGNCIKRQKPIAKRKTC